MTYRTLGEIFTAKETALERICRRAEGLTAGEIRKRAPGGGWSTEEILEHLVIVEGQLLQLIMTLLKRAEETSPGNSQEMVYAVSLGPILERSRREKYTTRDKFMPTGSVEAAASLSLLRKIHRELLELRPRLQLVDPTHARFPHWIFGPLDLGQWLAFIVVHEERHLAQIESIVQAT